MNEARPTAVNLRWAVERMRRVAKRGRADGMDDVALARRLEQEAARDLNAAYEFCGMLRNRLFLQFGRPVDSLPTDQDELTRLALSLGRFDAPRSSVREEYRRLTRRARRLVELHFYQD